MVQNRVLNIRLMAIVLTLLRPSRSLLLTTHPARFSLARSHRPSSSWRLYSSSTIEWSARTDCWRPEVNDVERISWGKPAKKKGTGSRGVPHRLTEDERKLFDLARTKGFLEVAGSGWRSQRRDSPLVNSYRSLCDARAQVCIVLNKGQTGMDHVSLDLSPLRTPGSFHDVAKKCLAEFPSAKGSLVREGEDDATEPSEGEDAQWKDRPIYQLPSFCVVWELPRSEAKSVGKSLASIFNTAEGKKASSKKPIGVKPGKSRRHGGYGIG